METLMDVLAVITVCGVIAVIGEGCVRLIGIHKRSKYQRGYLPDPQPDERDSIQQFRRLNN